MSRTADVGSVDRIADGVWVVRVPMPGNPLGYVHTYVFAADGGFVLVDPGCHAAESLAGLRDGLAAIGGDLEDVRGTVVTHVHPDHYGLAGTVRRVSGAWVALHEADAALIRARQDEVEALVDVNLDWLDDAGAPGDARDAMLVAHAIIQEHVLVTVPDRLLADGDRVPVDGGELRVVHTPGHTPGHICLHDAARDLVLTGDHVLPRVTPNVGRHALTGEAPLGDYLRSLERIRHLDGATVLPGHEWVFHGLAARIDVILEHHHQRMAEVLAVVERGADTAWAVAERLTWSRPFPSLGQEMRRAALGEALGHLLQLEEEGRVRPGGSRPRRWEPVG